MNRLNVVRESLRKTMSAEYPNETQLLSQKKRRNWESCEIPACRNWGWSKIGPKERWWASDDDDGILADKFHLHPNWTIQFQFFSHSPRLLNTSMPTFLLIISSQPFRYFSNPCPNLPQIALIHSNNQFGHRCSNNVINQRLLTRTKRPLSKEL